ncbi:MAG: hypothetical protein OEZ36_01355 [Spirochaetota bacterium]|nr:hypothetical protein [Spirochaetota bacterium]
MKKNTWSWLSDKEVECLMQIGEAQQEEIISFIKSNDTHIRTEVTIKPSYKLPEGKIIVLVSYQDVKRVFRSTQELGLHFKNNLYLKNTERNDGSEVRVKKRSRFFIVPKDFSKSCLQVLDKVADPKSGIDDINKLVTEIRSSQKPDEKTMGDEVQKDILSDMD